MKAETYEKIINKIFDFPPIKKFDEITSPYWDWSRGWSGVYGGSYYVEARFKLGKHWHLTLTKTALTHKEIEEEKETQK